LAVGVQASTTCNNFIADLLFLSEVSHSLLVAGAPCVHPYLGKSALLPIAHCPLLIIGYCLHCCLTITIASPPPPGVAAVRTNFLLRRAAGMSGGSREQWMPMARPRLPLAPYLAAGTPGGGGARSSSE
jgi:hypothetical protein